jgi:hypothetical protein
MYQIFEITLKPKEIDLERNLDKISKMNWYSNGRNLIKVDNGLQYILDLSSLKVKCIMSELFPIEEGKWLPEDYPFREEIIKTAITALKKLPFNLEIDEIRRVVKRER